MNLWSRTITFVLVGAHLLLGCTPAPRVPMAALRYDGDSGAAPRHLLVFLRGLGGSHTDFEKEGFVADIRTRRLPFDMVAPDAHMGYYKDRNVDHRLRKDVILPAKAAGYDKIWLVGVSMGGLGAVFYLRRFAADIDGVIMISPFLGWNGIVREIKAAGGVREWDPGPVATDDWQRLVWQWLKFYEGHQAELPPIYLGYGLNDPFSDGAQVLAAILPPGQVATVPGGHTYRVFKELWRLQLERAAFPSAPAAGRSASPPG